MTGSFPLYWIAFLPLLSGLALMLSGPRMRRSTAHLTALTALMASGASGVVYGRNVFQHKNTAGIIRALNAIVHENASVEDALRIIRGSPSMR